MTPLEQLEWEREALRRGSEPADVDARRQLEERIHEAREALFDAADEYATKILMALELPGWPEEHKDLIPGPSAFEPRQQKLVANSKHFTQTMEEALDYVLKAGA